MLDKIFSWSKKKSEEETEEEVLPDIIFGRYSDNNKSVFKVERWNAADSLYKEKKYFESIEAFFDYLRDDTIENVIHEKTAEGGKFCIYQGSKIIRGDYNSKGFKAEASLALMPQPSVPVMRRLLEMNFTLYYSRYAMSGDRLSMLFDSDIQTANPSKLYYGLKELATKTDKQDDLLVQDFSGLQDVDNQHLQQLPEWEKKIKYNYFKKWIKETLDIISGIDSDKFSGGIAYLLLSLAYRIDYLIVPEGKLLLSLEKIVEIYFRKDERPVTEKNQDMIDCYQKLLDKGEQDFMPYLFRSRYTFSIVTPQNFKTVADAIYNANQNIAWYKENKLYQVATQISEYGISYCQYSYSLPRPITEYFHLLMTINYGDYFRELGFKDSLYNPTTAEYNKEAILQKIEEIEARWKEKYPEMKMKSDRIKFDSPLSFTQSFTSEIEYLNMETK